MSRARREQAIERAVDHATVLRIRSRDVILSQLDPALDEAAKRDALIDALIMANGVAMDALRLATAAVDELGKRTAPATGKRQDVAAELARQADELKKRGRSVSEIAKQLDRSERTVYRHRKKRRNDETS